MATSKQVFSEKFIGIALLSLAGPFIWVLHFAVVYVVQHAACVTLGNRADFWVSASIIAITVVALSVLLVLIVKPDVLQRLDRDQIRQETTKTFFSGMMRLMALLSFFGVLWVGITLFFLPACGSVA
jgi:hypothetical protein